MRSQAAYTFTEIPKYRDFSTVRFKYASPGTRKGTSDTHGRVALIFAQGAWLFWTQFCHADLSEDLSDVLRDMFS